MGWELGYGMGWEVRDGMEGRGAMGTTATLIVGTLREVGERGRGRGGMLAGNPEGTKGGDVWPVLPVGPVSSIWCARDELAGWWLPFFEVLG